jgi:hypothetical protein
LDVLYGGLGISKLQFLIFFYSFVHQNTGSGLDPDPDPVSINPESETLIITCAFN